MANGTKAAKLRKYFKNNPEATTKEAAAWAKCSYGNAWSIKQEFCKKAVTGTDFDFPNARTFKSVVDDTGATKIELSHPPTPKYANDSRQDLINELPQTLVQDDKHEPVTTTPVVRGIRTVVPQSSMAWYRASSSFFASTTTCLEMVSSIVT